MARTLVDKADFCSKKEGKESQHEVWDAPLRAGALPDSVGMSGELPCCLSSLTSGYAPGPEEVQESGPIWGFEKTEAWETRGSGYLMCTISAGMHWLDP